MAFAYALTLPRGYQTVDLEAFGIDDPESAPFVGLMAQGADLLAYEPYLDAVSRHLILVRVTKTPVTVPSGWQDRIDFEFVDGLPGHRYRYQADDPAEVSPESVEYVCEHRSSGTTIVVSVVSIVGVDLELADAIGSSLGILET